jgi:hypothetical protein
MYTERPKDRVAQGDVLEEFEYNLWEHSSNALETTTITLPYAVVMSQDCDLQQDFDLRSKGDAQTQGQYIPSILLCPAFIAEKVKLGTHLEELNLQMQQWGSKQWGPITKNNNPRFHFLAADAEKGLPDLVIDFKRYYTLSRDEVYAAHATHYKISINELYRESLSQRFAYYLSRVALPELVEV